MSWVRRICSLFFIFFHVLPFHCTLTSGLGDREYAEFRSRLLPQTSDKDGQSTRHRTAGESIFRAIWDVPNFCKDNFSIELPLSDFGIEFNKNHRWRVGDVLNVFNHCFGRYPYVNATDGTVMNGGIPQLGNITDHLEKVAEDIKLQIPDPNYQGLGMIDWEEWYPQWLATEPRYRRFSVDHVRSRHPEWDNATITDVAKLEWTQSAKLFMESTLQLATQLRPKTLWGFYHYPYCTVKDNSSTCKPDQPKLNNEIMWLFNVSTIIYPSIYLKPEKTSDFEAAVEGRLAEAFRIRAKSNDPKGVVMSYTRFNYTYTDYYFTLQDLNHTILTSAEFGTHGVVIWGDNYDDKTKQTCQELRDYIINALGPTVVMAREGAESCSKRVCSGRGRCVGEVLTCGRCDQWQEKRKRDKKKQTGGVCSCRCFVGWEGDDCSIVTKY